MGLTSTQPLNQKLTPAQETACEVSQKKLDSGFNNMINARRDGNGPLFRPEEKFPFRNLSNLSGEEKHELTKEMFCSSGTVFRRAITARPGPGRQTRGRWRKSGSHERNQARG